MATTKIDIKNAINPKWLIDNGYYVQLPSNKVHQVRVSAIIWGNTTGNKVKDRVDQFLKATRGIETRMLHRYKSNNFAFNETNLGKKMFSKRDEVARFKKQSFHAEVKNKDTNLAEYHFRINLEKAEEFTVPRKPLLNHEKIIKTRNDELDKPVVIENLTEEKKEKIARSVCELFATGIYSLPEACDRSNINYLTFLTWTGNEFIRQMLVEANMIGRYLTSTRHISSADRMLTELLKSGKVSTITVHESRLLNQHCPEGVWIPDKRTTVERALDVKDLVLIKQIAQNIQLPTFGMSEAELMQDDELLRHIDEMRKRIENKQKDIDNETT